MEFKDFQEIFADIMPVLYKAAPAIGSMIGSPATGVILGLLGAIVQTNPCEHCLLAEKLSKDPDLYLKLKHLEETHSDWLKKVK